MAEEFARKLYVSDAWRCFRHNLIQERGPVCERCFKVMTDTSKLIGHHKIALTPQNIDNLSVTLSKDNVDLVCFDCHNKEHQRYGYVAQKRVYLVYGSPLSGKTSTVNQLMERGDMMLDMDKLFQAISGMPLYDKPDNLRFNVFALRDKMIDMVKTRYGGWHNAYIIGGYPVKVERERIARELGAELIYCESTKAQCLARIGIEKRKGVEWRKWIEKWWDDYTE